MIARDLTPQELRYAGREILADRVAKLQAEADQLRQRLAKPCGECHPCANYSSSAVEITERMVVEVIVAAQADGHAIDHSTARALAGATLRAAGIEVTLR